MTRARVAQVLITVAVAAVLIATISGCAAGPVTKVPFAHAASGTRHHPHRMPVLTMKDVLRRRPGGGQVVIVSIPATTGFRPRPALLYLPPVLRTRADHPLVVLELLHGTPGQPSDWFTRGQLQASADTFAAKHHGVAPLIVVPDLNGALRADSECIRTADGADVETYLTSDVVNYVRARYPGAVGRRPWTVAGLSEGGVCAAVLALRHPELYSAFGDFSGLGRPVVSHRTVAQTNLQLFADSRIQEDRHDPAWLLLHNRYPTMRALFECGRHDAAVLQAQERLVPLAIRAGVRVIAEQRSGRHTWRIWAQALRDLLPVLPEPGI